VDWYEKELRDQRHERTLFLDLDISESHSQGMVFEDCTFRRARFNASKHQDCAFVNCTFIGCDFFDSSFKDCSWSAACSIAASLAICRCRVVTGHLWACQVPICAALPLQEHASEKRT
jgi:uncharacterized protein YjbI with pentapeptide repeats